MSNTTAQTKWIGTSSKTAHANPWYKIREDDVIRPNGTTGKYFVVETKPSVVVIPFDGERFYLVQQYRYPVSSFSWSFPMGWAEDDNYLAQAQKELKEETGMTADTWTSLGSFYGMIGIGTTICHAFLAESLHQGAHHREETESGMQLRSFNLRELKTLLSHGTADGYALSALQLLQFKNELLTVEQSV